MRTLPKHIFDALVQLGHALLTVVPVNYRPLAIAAIPFVSALLLAYCVVTAPTAPTPVPVSGLTADGRDFNAYTDGKGNQLDIAQVAPLFGPPWHNQDIQERRQLVYCQEAYDVRVQQLVRDLLSQVSARYDGIDFFEQACPAPYTFGGTADHDCGMSGVVGCAAYLGVRSFRISHNAAGLANAWCRLGCVRAGLAHEIGHWFNLDHTPCDNPEPSTMSPIYVPDGPACASRGGLDFSWPDWALTEHYYNLQFRGTNPLPPGPPPPPVPKPTPLPTPIPTPMPTPPPKVVFQRWLEADREHCASPSGDFCISDNPIIPDGGAFYVLVRVHPDGTFDYPYPFVEVTP